MIAHLHVMMFNDYSTVNTVAHTCSALLIAIDNINTVCKIGL